jgi:hypothetical protein
MNRWIEKKTGVMLDERTNRQMNRQNEGRFDKQADKLTDG